MPQELPDIFVQLHALLAQHSSVWGRMSPVEEALFCDILSEVRPSPLLLPFDWGSLSIISPGGLRPA